jgi:RNA recognition motif-containing protein
MNIFVGNLSFSAKEEDVYKVFAGFGAVSDVVIVMEKKGRKSRGFGFVEMPVEQEALAAIAALNGKEILSRPVNVMAALPKKPKSEHAFKKESPHPQTGIYGRQGSYLERTGRYKQGKRSISYMKKRGITTAIPERKFKANPMRWRKKPRWPSPSQKTQADLKPGEKAEANQSRPWKKAEGGFKPWRKSSAGARKPRAGKVNLSRHKK